MEARVTMFLDKGLGGEPEGEHRVGACTNALSITSLESSLAISPARSGGRSRLGQPNCCIREIWTLTWQRQRLLEPLDLFVGPTD